MKEAGGFTPPDPLLYERSRGFHTPGPPWDIWAEKKRKGGQKFGNL